MHRRKYVQGRQWCRAADRPDGQHPGALLRQVLADGRRDRLGGPARLIRGGLQPARLTGRPKKLWDRSSGRIDPEVAKAWEAYDIRLVLERNWPTLGPKLKGKIHVITGGRDTFYLEGAVKLLKESLAKLGSDAVVEIIPG